MFSVTSGTKVKSRRKDEEKGKIEIEYYSNDELERKIYLLEQANKEAEKEVEEENDVDKEDK